MIYWIIFFASQEYYHIELERNIECLHYSPSKARFCQRNLYSDATSKAFKSDIIPLNRRVDKNTKGLLMTPYEEKSFHYNPNVDN